MDTIVMRRELFEIGGKQYKQCYRILEMALCIAREHLPREITLDSIAREISSQTGKKPLSIERAIARATKDLWEWGDRKALATYYRGWEYRRPSPKEFIYIFIRAIPHEE